MTFLGSTTLRLTFSIGAALSMLAQTSTMAAEAEPNRIRIEYVPPTNPEH
jgi:hypothetical protein